MTKQAHIYKCNVCGNIIEILHTGAGDLVCCNQPMELIKRKKTGEGKEKHIPLIEETETGVVVKVGSVPHPMEDEHYIEWIEITADDDLYRKFLSPGKKAEAGFCTGTQKILARAYCNIHGLWGLD